MESEDNRMRYTPLAYEDWDEIDTVTTKWSIVLSGVD